jgi:hypothetical protein
MRQDIPRNASPLITNTYNNMLRSLTNRNLNRRQLPIARRAVFECCLYAVSEQFADYVFEVREDVGECCGEVAG